MDQSAIIESKQPISREELHHLLDSEIDLISEQKNREGWTSWAVLGGLGTLGWLLWESLTKDTITWENSFTLLLIINIAYIAYACVKEAAGLTRQVPPFKRFRYIDPYFVSMGLTGIPTFLLLIWLAIVLSEGVPLPAVIWTVFTLAIYTLALVAYLILKYLRIPLPTFSEPKMRNTVVWSFVGFACMYSIYGYIHHLVSPTLYDLKVAVLLFAGLTLLGKLNPLKEAASSQAFINIRPQLILGQLDVETARRQTDITIAGMEASDVLRSEVEEFLATFAVVKKWREEQHEILDQVLDDLRRAEKPIPIKTLDSAKKRFDACEKYDKLCSDNLTPIKKKIDRLDKMEHWVSFGSTEQMAAANSIWDMIQKGIDDLGKARELRDEKTDAITGLMRTEIDKLKDEKAACK